MDSTNHTPPIQELKDDDDNEEKDPVELIIKPPQADTSFQKKKNEEIKKDGESKLNGFRLLNAFKNSIKNVFESDEEQNDDLKNGVVFHTKKLKNKAALRVRRTEDDNDNENYGEPDNQKNPNDKKSKTEEMSTNKSNKDAKSAKITKSLESDENESLSKNILVNLKAQIEKVNDKEIGKKYDKLLETYRLYEEEQNDDQTTSSPSKRKQNSNDKRSPNRRSSLKSSSSQSQSDHNSSSKNTPRSSKIQEKDKSSTRDKSGIRSTVVAVQDHKKDEKKEDLHKKEDKSRKEKEETHNNNKKDEKEKKDEKKSDVLKIVSRSGENINFPLKLVRYTKKLPAISYSENPKASKSQDKPRRDKHEKEKGKTSRDSSKKDERHDKNSSRHRKKDKKRDSLKKNRDKSKEKKTEKKEKVVEKEKEKVVEKEIEKEKIAEKEKEKAKDIDKEKDKEKEIEKEKVIEKKKDKEKEKDNQKEKEKEKKKEIEKEKEKDNSKDEIEEGEVRTPEVTPNIKALVKTPPLTPEMPSKNFEFEKSIKRSNEKDNREKLEPTSEKKTIKTETKTVDKSSVVKSDERRSEYGVKHPKSAKKDPIDLRHHIRELRQEREKKQERYDPKLDKPKMDSLDRKKSHSTEKLQTKEQSEKKPEKTEHKEKKENTENKAGKQEKAPIKEEPKKQEPSKTLQLEKEKEPGEISMTPPPLPPEKEKSVPIEIVPKSRFKPVCSFLSDIESDGSLLSKLSSKSSRVGDLSPMRFNEDDAEKSSSFDIFASSPENKEGKGSPFNEKLATEYEIFMKSVQVEKNPELDEICERIKEKNKDNDKSSKWSFVNVSAGKVGEFKSFSMKNSESKVEESKEVPNRKMSDIMLQVEKARDLISGKVSVLEKNQENKVLAKQESLEVKQKVKAVDEPSDDSEDEESEPSDTNSDTSSTASSDSDSSDSDSDDEGALPKGFSRLGGLINPLVPPMLTTPFSMKTGANSDKPGSIFTRDYGKNAATPIPIPSIPSVVVPSAIPTNNTALLVPPATPPSGKLFANNQTAPTLSSPFMALTPSPMKKVPIIDPNEPKTMRFEMVPFRIYSLKQSEEVINQTTGNTLIQPTYSSSSIHQDESREKRRKSRSRSRSPKRSRNDSKSGRSSRSPSRKRKLSPRNDRKRRSSPRRRSKSPRRRSRSRSPKKSRNRSPRRARSRSPKRPSRSPKRSSRSPRRDKASNRDKSLSPRHRKKKRSKTPIDKSKSSVDHSSNKIKPKEKPKSPVAKPKSPTRNWSPFERPKSPRRPKSPLVKSNSPSVRSRSPSRSHSISSRERSRSPKKIKSIANRIRSPPLRQFSRERSRSPKIIIARSPIVGPLCSPIDWDRSPGRQRSPVRPRSPVRARSPARPRSPLERHSKGSRSPINRQFNSMEFERPRSPLYNSRSISPIVMGRPKTPPSPMRGRSPLSPTFRNRSPMRPRSPPSPSMRNRSPRPRSPKSPMSRKKSPRISRSPRYRSISPNERKMRSPSPNMFRRDRSPYSSDEENRGYNRRYFRSRSRSRSLSKSPVNRRYRSPYSPPPFENSFGNRKDYPTSTTDSPIGYKTSLADSTISDTELEKQQTQFIHSQNEFFSSVENRYQSLPEEVQMSPKRLTLDERINIELGIPISEPQPRHHHHHNQPPQQQHQNFYPPHHQSQQRFPNYYPGEHYMSRPPPNLPPQMDYYAEEQEYDYEFPAASRNFVNKSNLVEIQQKEEPLLSHPKKLSKFAVQKGNVLEIVPTNKIPEDLVVKNEKPSSPPVLVNKESPQFSPPPIVIQAAQPKRPLTMEEIRIKNERRVDARKRRKADRETKRIEKKMRKQKLRMDIQRLIEIGVTPELSDDENMLDLRPVNISATANKTILKQGAKHTVKNKKSVMFSDGVMPGETSSSTDNEFIPNEYAKRIKMRHKKLKKIKKNALIKKRKGHDKEKLKFNVPELYIDPDLENAPPPHAPTGNPPSNLEQPRLTHYTADMMIRFQVNLMPIYFDASNKQIMGLRPPNPLFNMAFRPCLPVQVMMPPNRACPPMRFPPFSPFPANGMPLPIPFPDQQFRSAMPMMRGMPPIPTPHVINSFRPPFGRPPFPQNYYQQSPSPDLGVFPNPHFPGPDMRKMHLPS